MSVPLVVAVHASAAQANGGALIFLGPSGTGKSTICAMLSDYAPQMAADTVYLVPRPDGQWGVADGGRRAYEGPLSEEEAGALPTVPLRAILRLFQAPAPHLEPLAALKTCRYLTDALFEVAWQRGYDVVTKKALFARLAAICRATPGYELHFDLSAATLRLLKEELGPLSGPQSSAEPAEITHRASSRSDAGCSPILLRRPAGIGTKRTA